MGAVIEMRFAAEAFGSGRTRGGKEHTMVRTRPGAMQFIFEDPHASRVEIHGAGPDGFERAWPMTALPDGRWEASLRVDRGVERRFDFRYLVDGRFWALDAAIRTIVRDEFGHCRSRLATC